MSILIQTQEAANPRIRTTLYAIAFERYSKRTKRWTAEIEYVHAEDAVHARNQFCLAHPNRRTCHIAAIGPAVGFFAADDHGDKLIA